MSAALFGSRYGVTKIGFGSSESRFRTFRYYDAMSSLVELQLILRVTKGLFRLLFRGGGNGLPVSSYPPTVNAIRELPVPALASFVVWVGKDGRIVELEALSLTDDLWPAQAEEGFHSFQDDQGNPLNVAEILAE